MSTPDSRALLSDLRRRGVTIELDGDRLHIEAPKGILTSERKQTLHSLKPDLISTLAQEARLLAMSLEEFGRWDHAVELSVPWLDDTLWFVPRVEHVAGLVREGVNRGRIWTARELIDLAAIPGMSRVDIERIGRLKAAFGADILSVTPDRKGD